MIELSRHIESLLLEHNCVIVPDLGGFVTQYVPARYVAEERLFLPPCRNVGFNPQLTLNDGLLVESYMQTYDTSYPEATKMIAAAVDSLREELKESGELELHGIGKIRLSMDGHYDFEPCEAGVLSPELYALDAVIVARRDAETEEPAEEKIKAIRAPKKKKKSAAYVVRINKELVNYAAAAVITVVSYFLWATPVVDDGNARAKMAEASFAVPSSIVRTAPKVPTASPVAVKSTESQAQQKASASPRIQTASSSLSKGYTIVLASSITPENAGIYVKKLNDNGTSQARVYQKGKMVRVVYGLYKNEQEARASLHSLQNNSDFAEAWIMEVKD